MLMDIEKIRIYVKEGKIIWRNHALIRMRQRGIGTDDIMNCINTGEIIESYPDDYPYPSSLILGKTISNKDLHVVCAEGQDRTWIITSYYPDQEEWFEDMRTRRR